MNAAPPLPPSAPAPAPTPAAVLAARARLLARQHDEARTPAAGREVVVFELAGAPYAVEVCWVREVCPLHDLTPVPCTPAYVRGIVNVRGQILTLLDLREFFAASHQGLADRPQVLILEVAPVVAGLLVDRIQGVRWLADSDVQSRPPTLTGPHAEFVRGVTAERLVLLDAARLLSAPQLVVNEEVP